MIRIVLNTTSEGISPTITSAYCDQVAKHILVYDNGYSAIGVAELQLYIGKTKDMKHLVWEWGHGWIKGGVYEWTVFPTLTLSNIANWLYLIIEIKQMNINKEQAKNWCVVEDADGNKYRLRIRKLTPKECARFMDVSDEDADKMLAVNSKSQCYKQYGNSIVVACMTGIFRNLFINPEKEIEVMRYKQLTIF